ncbi:unnamed protein product [Anisakis simplex]|uniref:Protein aurora borealis n=1 Tax=Anisakis simplex TaxID=6269 RepID=A0A0M3K1E3_ANISI|nr:unnamed protein product [Anisakis simplex]
MIRKPHTTSKFDSTHMVWYSGQPSEDATEVNDERNASGRSTGKAITLEDIIACARRKVSSDYVEAPMPDNVLTMMSSERMPQFDRDLDEILSVKTTVTSPPSTRISTREMTKPEDFLDDKSSFVNGLLDSESVTFISAEPPSLDVDDDLDHIISASTPSDMYSNPIMHTADPLSECLRRSHLMKADFSLDFSTVDLNAANCVNADAPAEGSFRSMERKDAEYLDSL